MSETLAVDFVIACSSLDKIGDRGFLIIDSRVYDIVAIIAIHLLCAVGSVNDVVASSAITPVL
jgi:hypothetical protein